MEEHDRLTGERVRLASIREADIDAIIAWDDDPEFLRMLHSGPAYPRPEAAQREWWAERLKKKDEYHFAIRLLDNDRPIGTFHIEDIEWPHRVAWFSIGIGDRSARGKGYGREALALGIAFAFDDLNLHRLSLSVFAYNEPAVRLYQRLGFTHEGTFREYLQRDGQRHDMLLFGLLAYEWRRRLPPGPSLEFERGG
jgi:RimJ/RimL family protein N-acetyltransferase